MFITIYEWIFGGLYVIKSINSNGDIVAIKIQEQDIKNIRTGKPIIMLPSDKNSKTFSQNEFNSLFYPRMTVEK